MLMHFCSARLSQPAQGIFLDTTFPHSTKKKENMFREKPQEECLTTDGEIF